MTSGTVERARLLYDTNRYSDAIAELRAEIASNPDNSEAQTLLALSLSSLAQHKEAIEAAKRAVTINPEGPYEHYGLAYVLHMADKDDEAERSALETLRLAPYFVGGLGLLASIRLSRANWNGALEAATRGLELEADDVMCNNARTRALLKLGRKSEAGLAIDATLSFEPDNAYSHANKGWMLLESGDRHGAIAHFREALRLEPGMAWAKEGLISAIKVANPIYRFVFDYFMWMSRFSASTRRGIVIGLWIGMQAMTTAAKTSPISASIASVVGPVYMLFCFVSWTADPLMNALLRFHPVGKYALTRQQTIGANWVSLSLATSIVFGALAFYTHKAMWICGAVGYLFVTYLVSISVTNRDPGWRALFGILSALLAAGVIWVMVT